MVESSAEDGEAEAFEFGLKQASREKRGGGEFSGAGGEGGGVGVVVTTRPHP